MTSCMRSRRVFDNPDVLMIFLPAVLFRLADGAAMPTGEASAAETVWLLRNLRRSSSDMSSPFTSPLLLTPLLAGFSSPSKDTATEIPPQKSASLGFQSE